MKISLKDYSDLGKCTAFTLREQFDTEVDKIYLACFNFEDILTLCEIPIETIEDLIPWLWNQFTIITASEGEYRYITFCPKPEAWWDRCYDSGYKESLEKRKLEVIEKIKKSN